MERRTQTWPRRTVWMLGLLFVLVLLLGIVIGILSADFFFVDRKMSASTATATIIATETATTVPPSTHTPFPTATASVMPTSMATPAPSPTMSPTPTPTPSPTPTPVREVVIPPTSVPTKTPTVKPTQVVPPTVTPTPAIVDWRGAYYNNATLSGEPVVVRNDRTVDFNWDYGSPMPGFPSDAFSVRWTRTLNFQGGWYRFYASMDDGLMLSIDGELLIDEWKDGGLRQVTAERDLEPGSYTVEVMYYDMQGAARAHVWWERPDAYADWQGVYWANPQMEGSPALIRNDAQIAFNWGDGPPADTMPVDQFSARWTRQISLEGGTYSFYVQVDDGARLWVDGEMIIDEWADHDLRELTASRALSQGEHTIRLEYYENTLEARVSLWWDRIDELAYPDWKGEYWANQDLLGRPTVVRNDEEIDFRWESGSPAPGLPVDRFSARWSRQMTMVPGMYRFSARADDGIRAYIDERLVLNEWHSSRDVVYEIDVRLAGEHTLRVEYYEGTGDARAYVWWRRIKNYPY